MLDRTVIYKGLAQHLQNTFSSPANISWENVKFNKEGKTFWIKEYFFPNDSEPVTIGKTNGTVNDFGMYQINVYTEAGTGTVLANTYINELSNLYKIGTPITVDGYVINIRRTTPAKGTEFDGWWVTPLTIYWSCEMTIN